MLALQQRRLKATRRVKSTVRFSVHLRLGRQGDSRRDPNIGPQSKEKKKKEKGKSALLLYEPHTR